MTQPAWPDETRDAALVEYLNSGAAEAARKSGVPAPTISSWVRRMGLPHFPARGDAETRRRWADWRGELADGIGYIAGRAAERMLEAIEEGRTIDAQRLAVTMGIACEKANLLSGLPTSIPAHADVARITELVAKLQRERERTGSDS